jgi:ATP-binding cassette, subfamily C, bacterial LapB
MANLAPALLVSALVDLPFFVLMLVLIASLAGPVVLAPILGTAALVALHLYTHARARRAAEAHGGLSRRQHQLMIDTVAAQERIRATGAAGAFLARFEQAADDAAFAGHEIRYWQGLAAQASAVLVQVVIVAAVIIGVVQIGKAAMTLGALSACILLVNRAMMPISILTGLAFRLRQMLAAAGPAGQLIAARPETGGAERGTGVIRGDLGFTGVGFTYADEDRPALAGLDLTIRAGERIGLIGKSGCGKSSLLRLILRLQEPGEGRIKLDERDIRQYDPAALRAAIGYMPQESVLIDGTLQDNLLLGLPGVDAALFERICRMTGVHELAARHPRGLSLQVGPGGQRLSAGERQCVSLARALMGQPALLLLDEPTSAFDNGHEARLVAELGRLPPETGMVIATHRMAMLKLVDRVIWLDGGRIIADGPRDEVFRRHGLVA